MYPPALQEKNEKNCEAFQKTEHLLEEAFWKALSPKFKFIDAH